jgi:competence protein ComEA
VYGKDSGVRVYQTIWDLILVGVVGLGVLIYGMWGQLVPERASVEIVKTGSQSSEHSLAQGSELVVDVAGAVERPGVYKLPKGSRIGDALVLAGGLSAKADREWVASTLNLASEIKDGQKVYIPRQSENSENQKTRVSENQSGKVNINTAGAGELDTLAGIGEVRAQMIIGNRPYGSIEELVSKAKIPQSIYEKIKDSISIY